MQILLFYTYETLSSLLPFLALVLIRKIARVKNNHALAQPRFAAFLVFSLYIIGVLHVTGTGTLYDVLQYRLEIPAAQVNLIPFSRGIDALSYFLNVLLFLPFGLLIPTNLEEPRRLFSGFAYAVLFSLLVEASQLLNHRATDIDDLLMNTAGAAIGFGLGKFRPHRRRQNTIPETEGMIILAILTLFLGRFFLFNEMGFAKLLYHF